MSDRIKLNKVRLSYPNLFKAKAFGNDGGGDPKFSCTFILDKKKDKEQIDALRKEIDALQKESKIKTNKICLHDGAESDKEGYGADVMFVRCSSSEERPPATVDRNPNKRLTAADDKLYGGAIVNGWISLWAQNNSFGQRVNANVLIVQFVEDGTRYGDSPVDPVEACENLETEEESVL